MNTIETIHTSQLPIRVKCYAHPESSGFDRFTIFCVDEPSSPTNPRLRNCLGLSGWGSGVPGRHLGKRIPFDTMPESLKNRIIHST